MPYVFNPLDEEVSVQVFGNWINVKPGQIKMIHQEKFVEFIMHKRKESGLVDISEAMAERILPKIDPKDTEAQEYMKAKTKEGYTNAIRALEVVKHNLEVSLRRDLEMASIKADPLVYASEGEVQAYQKLARYKDHVTKNTESNADKIRKLKESTDGNA